MSIDLQTPRRAARHAAPRLFALLLACLFAMPAAAVVNAVLERGEVALGESVRLVLETDRQSSAGPELAPLRKDFDVLSTSQSTQVQIANGQQTVTARWIIELLPRRAGTLTVPAIAVGGATSQPLTLEVRPAPAAGAGGGALFMEAEVEPGRHYVQGQLLYRVRLYSAVPILGGSLSPPEAANTSVQRLGEDAAYTAVRGGRRYDVVERRYALFPQRSGTLRIGAARFTGQVSDVASGLTAMDRLLNRGRRATVTAPPQEVEIAAEQPGFSTAEWLPARDLRLEDGWPDGLRAVHVGEPITRILKLQARGLLATQLSLPTTPDMEAVKRYPDQLQTSNENDGEWLTGTVEQRVALMPTRPGDIVLPEIRLRWWDVGSDRERIAVVPARTLTVLPAIPPAGASDTTTVADAAAPTSTATVVSAGYWPMLSALLLALWLATLAAWWRARRTSPAAAASGTPDTRSEAATLRRARHAVADACIRHDPHAARDALMAFARLAWPERPPAGLSALASCIGDPELGAELHRLERSLYSAAPLAWRGDTLRALATRGLVARTSNPPTERDPLPPLNPPMRSDRQLEA